jgi:hypothetical protein
VHSLIQHLSSPSILSFLILLFPQLILRARFISSRVRGELLLELNL